MAYEPTLIEITSKRPDVLSTAKAQGGDPYTAGSEANTWLNDWYNRIGKAEGADMVAKGIIATPQVPDFLNAEDLNKNVQDYSSALAQNEEAKKKAEADFKSSLIPSIEAPTAPGLETKYTGLLQSEGIDALNTNLIAKKQEILKLQDEWKLEKQAMEAGTQTSSHISGQISKAGAERQGQLDTLLREKQLMIDELTVKQNIVSNIMQFAQTDYQTAKNNYDTKFSQNLQIQTAIQNFKSAEEAKENKLQTDARANLDTMMSSMSDNKISYDKLSQEAQLTFNNLAMKAGINPNVYKEILSVKPKKVIKNTIMSKDNTQGVILYDDGTMQSFSTGFAASVERVTLSKKQSETLDTVRQQLLTSIDADGYVNTALYGKLKLQNPEVFKWLPPEELLNPKDPAALKYFQTPTQMIKETQKTGDDEVKKWADAISNGNFITKEGTVDWAKIPQASRIGVSEELDRRGLFEEEENKDKKDFISGVGEFVGAPFKSGAEWLINKLF